MVRSVSLPVLQWKGEIQEFCPNTKMLLVGCKSDLRTDLSTLVELSNHRRMPVSYDQVRHRHHTDDTNASYHAFFSPLLPDHVILNVIPMLKSDESRELSRTGFGVTEPM